MIKNILKSSKKQNAKKFSFFDTILLNKMLRDLVSAAQLVWSQVALKISRLSAFEKSHSFLRAKVYSFGKLMAKIYICAPFRQRIHQLQCLKYRIFYQIFYKIYFEKYKFERSRSIFFEREREQKLFKLECHSELRSKIMIQRWAY